MTQTPPSPAQGIAVAPTTVAAGVTSSIPFPAAASGGPTPWRTPWLVLLNSSPYTLVVSTGSTTTQIAAFTSDKVFVFSTGLELPVTVTPEPGAGTPNPASDFTVYATWYHDVPPGTYPAALGSGAVTNGIVSVVFVESLHTLADLATDIFGPFSAQGFGGGLTLTLTVNTGGPLRVQVVWQDAAATTTIGTKQAIVAGLLAVSTPHRGQTFTVRVTNTSGAPATWSGNAYQTQTPIEAWNFNVPVLIGPTGTSCPDSTPTVIGTSPVTYAGPASWFVFWNNTTTGQMVIQTQDANGAWATLYEQRIGAAPATSTLVEPPPLSILLPAQPVRLLVVQTSGGPTTPIATLMADDWRISA